MCFKCCICVLQCVCGCDEGMKRVMFLSLVCWGFFVRRLSADGMMLRLCVTSPRLIQAVRTFLCLELGIVNAQTHQTPREDIEHNQAHTSTNSTTNHTQSDHRHKHQPQEQSSHTQPSHTQHHENTTKSNEILPVRRNQWIQRYTRKGLTGKRVNQVGGAPPGGGKCQHV